MQIYKSILITGGNGMLAHAFIRNLETRGYMPAVIDRASCDITRATDVRAAFEQYKPSLLLNCSAHTKVDLCEQQQDLADAVNGYGLGILARESRKYGTFLVHFSTDFVFDGKGTRPYRTDDPVGPVSAYGRSKLLGEREIVNNAPEQWLIARTAWLYGRNGPNFPRTMVERGRAGLPLKVVNDQIGSPTYTEDLAAATLDLVERNATGIWHLGNSGQTNWFDFAKAALEEFGVTVEVAPTTSAEWFKIRPTSATRPAYSVLDVSPFERLVGRSMRPWRDALRDYATAASAHGF